MPERQQADEDRRARAQSAIVLGRESTVAETVTGARIRIANGLSSPPVR